MSDHRTALIHVEQLRTYFREASDQAIAGCVAIGLFAVLASRTLPVWGVLIPTIAVWLLAADLWRVSRRVDRTDAAKYSFWEWRQLIEGSLAGLCWGGLSAALVLNAELGDKFFAVMLVSIVATVSAGDGSAMRRPTLALILACVLPPMLTAAWVGDGLHWLLFGMLAVLLQINWVQATKRHQAFISLIEARLDLEEMTRDLAAAKARAEAGSAAKTAFLANMSHELRTPMNAILGLSNLLEREVDQSPVQRERLIQIRSAGNHLLGIIDQVLDVARADVVSMALIERDFDPVDVIDQALGMVRAEAERKGLNLRFEHGLPDWRIVHGDAGRLRQAVLNYLANAVKFTEQGEVRVSASGLAIRAGEMSLRVEVRDTGPGIPSAVLQRLFKPFEQADASITRRYGGTGLGLALTRQIVRAMNGEAGAESEPGVGSCFWLNVRLKTAAVSPSESARSMRAADDLADAARILRRRHAGRQVLVAEDNPINRELLQRLLETAGLRVDTAADGVEAVSMAGAGRYAAILMDVQMPRLDGLSAARQLRKIPVLADVPILAVSASIFDDDRRDCLAAGMNDLIGKPILPGTLFGTLLRHLPA